MKYFGEGLGIAFILLGVAALMYSCDDIARHCLDAKCNWVDKNCYCVKGSP